MNSRERVLVALDHREPDRVPFDLGGTVDSGIHVEAYRRLRSHLGLETAGPMTCAERIMNIAVVEDDVAELLRIDTTPASMYISSPDAYYHSVEREGAHDVLQDAFGVKLFKPIQGGLYYDPRTPPPSGPTLTEETVSALRWPVFSKSAVITPLQEATRALANSTSRALIMGAGAMGGSSSARPG